MVTLLIVGAFALGLMCGAVLLVLVQIKPVQAPPKSEGMIDWFRKIGAVHDVPKSIPTQTLTRKAGSWRTMRKDLERNHNSAQRERDTRIPHV